MKILKKRGVVEKRGEEETKSMPHAPVTKNLKNKTEFHDERKIIFILVQCILSVCTDHGE